MSTMKIQFKKFVLVLCCLTVLALIFSACSSDKNVEKKSKELSSKEIAKTIGKDVVFLENDFATGSGILLDNGYILTNEHVVDGFDKVDVTLESGKTHEDVKVYAIDVSLDLALVGPIKEKSKIKFGTTKKLGKGDEIYLVGYPEETDEKPDTTITKGILSRVRKSADKKTVFLQTDAAITGGQSGGAMVNTKGELIGLSGLGDDTFGFSVSIENIKESIKSMEKNKTKPYMAFPTKTDDKRAKTEHEIKTVNRYDTLTYNAYFEDKTTLTLEFPTDAIPALQISDYFEEIDPKYNSQYVDAVKEVAKSVATESDIDPTTQLDTLQPTLKPKSPGKYEVEIPQDTYLTILLGTNNINSDTFTSQMKSNIGLVYHAIREPLTNLTLDKKVKFEIDAFESLKQFSFNFEKGKKYEISLRSRVGDSYFMLYPATRLPVKQIDEDDTEDDAGIFGYDAILEFEPEETEPYIISVPTDSFATHEYTIVVTDITGKKDSKDKKKDS